MNDESLITTSNSLIANNQFKSFTYYKVERVGIKSLLCRSHLSLLGQCLSLDLLGLLDEHLGIHES